MLYNSVQNRQGAARRSAKHPENQDANKENFENSTGVCSYLKDGVKLLRTAR